jgi:membrane protein
MAFIHKTKTRVEEGSIAELLRRLWEEIFSDHATMVAAGLAYYAIFGLLPALAAAAAIWGQFGDIGALKQGLQHNGSMLPAATVQLMDEFLTSVPRGFGGGVALLVNLVFVLWIAFRAAGGLLTALNIVYDQEETRSRTRRAAVALAVGTAGIAMLFVVIGLLALAPLLASWLQMETALRLLWLRWPVMIAIFAASLALLFRYAPNRTPSHLLPLCWGTAVATLLCLAASAGISLYVAHLANFGRLYGSLGSIAVVLLWLYANALALLVGAEVDNVLSERLDAA